MSDTEVKNEIPPWRRIAVTAKTASEMLGLTPLQFHRMVKDGLLPQPHPSIRRWSVEALRVAKEAMDRRASEGKPTKRYERRPQSVPLREGATHLYRHYDKNGRLLYVGISLSAIARLGEHKKSSHWFWQIARIEVTAYATRASALKAERITIQREKPLHNIKHAEAA
jgi:hypothetical protein